jgi:hypothetical protein
LPLLLGSCGDPKDDIRELEREKERASFELLTGPTKKLLADNISYEIKDGKATLTDFRYYDFLTEGTVRWAIPEKIDGHPVTVIGEDSFDSDSAGASHVTIPNSVVRIERRAFQWSPHLRSLLIGDGLTSMGLSVFFYSKSIESVAFLGDAPKVDPFVRPNPLFGDSHNPTPTIFITPEARGWGSTFEGAPVKVLTAKQTEQLRQKIQASTFGGATPPAKNGKKFPSSYKELMLGSNPVVTDKDKAFWEAAKSGNLEAVQRLLSGGVDVDIYSSTIGAYFGCTALFWAAKHNHKEVVQFLLEKNAYIDAGVGMGGSPLHIAAYEGHPEVVELLISEGANAEAKTVDGETVFDFANEEIAALIRKGIEERRK